jgi:hypothetical protein
MLRRSSRASWRIDTIERGCLRVNRCVVGTTESFSFRATMTEITDCRLGLSMHNRLDTPRVRCGGCGWILWLVDGRCRCRSVGVDDGGAARVRPFGSKRFSYLLDLFGSRGFRIFWIQKVFVSFGSNSYLLDKVFVSFLPAISPLSFPSHL